jgi:hypothetical protein
MEIHASSKFDKKTITAFSHAATFKKLNPQKHVAVMLILSLLGVLCCVLGTFFLKGNYIFHCVMFSLCGALDLYLYFGIPAIQYKGLGKMQGIENRFVFGLSDFRETSKSDSYSGEGVIAYSALFKIVETKEYLYLFQTKLQANIVDKSTLSEADMIALRERLTMFLGKKYEIYKY